jgi:hypothetical protein
MKLEESDKKNYIISKGFISWPVFPKRAEKNDKIPCDSLLRNSEGGEV